MSKVIAILTADIHLSETTPVCRTDDFEATMWAKIDYLSQLQRQYDCPILHAGDLFDYWKPSPEMLSKCIERLPAQFYTVYGNHDLPNHNYELREKSGVHTLEQAGVVSILSVGHWGLAPTCPSIVIKGIKILVYHIMTWHKIPPYPGCSSGNAKKLMSDFPEMDIIVTGDNHEPFVVKSNGGVLINPGSLMRRTADQYDHEPRVYLLYSDKTVEAVYLPINLEAVSRDHLDKAQERDERIEAFIEALSQDWTITLSFEENLERFFEKNKVRQSVKQLIYDAL